MIRALGGEREVAELSEIEGWAFGFPAPDAAGWLQTAGHENVRVALEDRHVVGGLLLVPMGQWFGRKRVTMTGIAGVAVAPEMRGRGIALELMHGALEELRAAGVPLSTLYPATVSLYRLAGYECAGSRMRLSAKPALIGVSDRALELRRATEADASEVERVYAEVSSQADGSLDRGPYIWRRVRTPRGATANGWVVEADGRVEGYVYASEKNSTGLAYDVVLTDVAALTARAARRILTFLADHRTLAQSVVWHSGPTDPLIAVMPENAYEMKLDHQWMLRVVDVAHALEARGYAASVNGALELEVADDVLPENSGRYRLEVEAGRARVTRGGNGALRLDVRSLAALYSGFASPFALARTSTLSGERAALELAAALFAGPHPAMRDMF